VDLFIQWKLVYYVLCFIDQYVQERYLFMIQFSSVQCLNHWLYFVFTQIRTLQPFHLFDQVVQQSSVSALFMHVIEYIGIRLDQIEYCLITVWVHLFFYQMDQMDLHFRYKLLDLVFEEVLVISDSFDIILYSVQFQKQSIKEH